MIRPSFKLSSTRSWRKAGAKPGPRSTSSALQARAEPFGLDSIPAEVLVLTAGCDVQDDRLEITLAGWTRDGTALVLGHVVIWGTPGRRLDVARARRIAQNPLAASARRQAAH